MNWKVAGMASTAVLTLALSGLSATAGANKFTGNISLAVGQSFEDDNLTLSPFDDSYASITGAAQLNVAFSNNINLQFDFAGVGSFADQSVPGFSLDRDAGFQGGAHLYWRNDRYAAGVFGGVGIASGADLGGVSPSAEYYFVGAQGQYYWNNFTFGLGGGYLTSDSDELGLPDDVFVNDAWFADADVRWYVNNKFTLAANIGYISGDALSGAADVETWHWGAKAEYWPEEKEPLSLWVAYEGRDTTADFTGSTFEVEKENHTIKIGVTFHFGVDGGTQSNDRQGPAFNQMDYGAIVVGG